MVGFAGGEVETIDRVISGDQRREGEVPRRRGEQRGSDPTLQLRLIPKSQATCNRADVDAVSARPVASSAHPTDQPVLLAEGIYRLLRLRVQVCKRNISQREVLCLNDPTIQILADISTWARSKTNESVGVVRPVDQASMVCALSTEGGYKVEFVEWLTVLFAVWGKWAWKIKVRK